MSNDQMMKPSERIGYDVTESDYQWHQQWENEKTGLIHQALQSINEALLYVGNANYAHYFTYKQLNDADAAARLFYQKVKQVLESNRGIFESCYREIWDDWHESIDEISRIAEPVLPLPPEMNPIIGLCGEFARIPVWMVIHTNESLDAKIFLQCPEDPASKQQDMAAGGRSIYQYEYLLFTAGCFCVPSLNYHGFTEESIKKDKFARVNHLCHVGSMTHSAGFSSSCSGIMNQLSVERLFELISQLEFNVGLTKAYILCQLNRELRYIGCLACSKTDNPEKQRRFRELFEKFNDIIGAAVAQYAKGWLFDQWNQLT